MILASSAPGVFGGDGLQQIIRVERGARVRLTSQSALQVHPAPGGTLARLLMTCHIEDDAQLQCQWDPLIPFAGARVDQQIEVCIGGRGMLYWSDALMCGRQARGERWMFASLAHQITVSRGGALEYMERYRLEPNARDVSRLWVAAEASYLGTTLVTGPDIESDAAELLHAELAALTSVRAAVDRLDSRSLLVRLMGPSGPSFHQARLQVARALGSLLNPQ
jgi:urease accessory protein